VGIRPLVKPPGAGDGKTSSISRDYTIHIDNSGLLTIVGGKWTTYRHMAEDCVDHAVTLGRLEERPCVTKTMRIHGYQEDTEELGELGVYGSDASKILALAQENPPLAKRLHPDLPYIGAEIVWAARFEMSRTLDDALSRRTRALLLNARAAVAIAPAAAALLAGELGKEEAWAQAQVESFCSLAKQYIPQGIAYPEMPLP
jgi:glycerol-3-phosphate dehydrogenase